VKHEDREAAGISLWFPSWETHPPARNLERPEAENVPFHFLVSWAIRFVARRGTFSARHAFKKSGVTGSLRMWVVHGLVKSACWRGDRFRTSDLALLSSALSSYFSLSREN
jgi:hypothetical protein